MPPRRRIDPKQGRVALDEWLAEPDAAPRTVVATATRWALEELTLMAPGRSVEVRVPPFGATQIIEGPTHTRGTPPNVIELDPATWLGLVSGRLRWDDALASGAVHTSGIRADISEYLPLAPERE